MASNSTTPSLQMFAFAPLGVWADILARGGGIESRYIGRAAQALLSSALSAPVRVYEKLRYSREISRVRLHESPIFIMGYGRSGTTHLHNLLVQDPEHICITTFQAMAPGLFLSGRRWLKPFMARHMPSVRPMDNVAVSVDAPQEEEIAIANMSRMSMLHHLSVPKKQEEFFRRYVLFEGLGERERRQWKRLYLEMLRKATLAAGGGRLVLKSPTNLGRVPALLEMFPRARFVHIHRNPYEVFPSILNLYRRLLPAQQLHTVDHDTIKKKLLAHYRLMFERFYQDVALIPEGHFTEIRFDDLDREPIGTLESLYETLDLGPFERTRTHVESYLTSLGRFKKNRFEPDPILMKEVEEHWGFAINRWGYHPPTPHPHSKRAGEASIHRSNARESVCGQQ